MCRPVDIKIRVGVGSGEGLQQWTPLDATPRRRYIEDIVLFREETFKWFEMKYYDGENKICIPSLVYFLLFKSSYDDFFVLKEGMMSFRVWYFFLVLTFFESNGIPQFIRRRWWRLFFEEPIFHVNGGCGHLHPYMQMYFTVKRIPIEKLGVNGGFYNIATRSNVIVLARQSFNVWDCCGYWIEGEQGRSRMVDTVLIQATEEGDVIDWNMFGAVSPVTRLAEPNPCEPIFAIDDCFIVPPQICLE